ncbi:MAG: sigma-54-dependent Fis family transcriptional regulator [Ignavibacteriaceae bacterium]|nr:sigma-54-dependent Fis family transcriptional regulator [Ignavibacteriaceae bacterium]
MAYKILVVDDEDIIRDSISFILKKEGYVVEEAENGLIAYEKLQKDFFDLVITDIEMPQMKGIELLEKGSLIATQTAFVVITAYGSLDTAIRALRSGASDYILKPIEFDELLFKLKKLFDLKSIISENNMLKRELQRDYDFSRIIGKSRSMQKVFDMIKMVSQTDSTVLITGNSGTGKELVARAIHVNSAREKKPFLAINCGAISENLIESELFGHKKGAFTGAITDKEGFVKAAEGGTLFLDEVSEMPLQLQVKLLRVLQEKEFTPVGTTYSLPADIRFIASTNRNLQEQVAKGTFREDLYYRLNVVELNLPSLKKRKEDIPHLIDHFINKYRAQMNKNIRGVQPEVLRALSNYDFKGEIRELENLIERAIIFAHSETLTLADFPESFNPNKEGYPPEKIGSLNEYIEKVERDYILRALELNDYNKEKAAEALELGLSTLYRKIKELDITID